MHGRWIQYVCSTSFHREFIALQFRFLLFVPSSSWGSHKIWCIFKFVGVRATNFSTSQLIYVFRSSVRFFSARFPKHKQNCAINLWNGLFFFPLSPLRCFYRLFRFRVNFCFIPCFDVEERETLKFGYFGWFKMSERQ